MAAQSHAMPADIRVLHMNIVEKMKFSKNFETLFSDLKRCVAVSMTYLHSDNTIFREKINRVPSLSLSFTKYQKVLVTINFFTIAYFKIQLVMSSYYNKALQGKLYEHFFQLTSFY